MLAEVAASSSTSKTRIAKTSLASGPGGDRIVILNDYYPGRLINHYRQGLNRQPACDLWFNAILAAAAADSSRAAGTQPPKRSPRWSPPDEHVAEPSPPAPLGTRRAAPLFGRARSLGGPPAARCAAVALGNRGGDRGRTQRAEDRCCLPDLCRAPPGEAEETRALDRGY